VRGLVMWRGGSEEEMSRATRWAEDGLVRWRQRCAECCLLAAWSVGGKDRCEVCCAERTLEELASGIHVLLARVGTSAA
jgi:hypothetical protein